MIETYIFFVLIVLALWGIIGTVPLIFTIINVMRGDGDDDIQKLTRKMILCGQSAWVLIAMFYLVDKFSH